MAELRIRPTRGDDERRHHITPQSAGWTYVGFDMWELEAPDFVKGGKDDREVCLVFVAGKGKVTVDGQAVKLTSHELRLLSYLMHHKGKVISRTELTEHLYDQDFDRDSNTIEVFVGRLRKKLPEEVIETVRGLGYQIRGE